jgi:hypothetical protein
MFEPDERTRTQEMLADRYDNLKSGRVKPVSSEEIVAHFREKSAACPGVPWKRSGGTYGFFPNSHTKPLVDLTK